MHRQQGAVLVISLIFLLLITAIAVASMTGGTQQTMVVSNAQQREAVFRSAESVVEQTLTLANYNQAMNKPIGEPYTAAATSHVADSSATAKIACKSRRLPLNGWEIGSYAVFVYEASGAIETDDERIQTEVLQGVGTMLPTPNGDQRCTKS